MLKPNITTSFDPTISTCSYMMRDPSSRTYAIVDPVPNYDPIAGRTSHASAEYLIAHVRQHDLRVEWLLETHVCADRLSTATFLQRELGGRLAIGARITQVQTKFSDPLNLGETLLVDGRQLGHLFEDGESFRIDALEYHALHTLGHTPTCMIYLVGDSVLVGDTLFMPDYDTTRYDSPDSDAHQLYRSIQRLFTLPGATRLFTCHSYTASGRNEHHYETSVGEQRRHNVHVREDVNEEMFVAIRQQRDAILGMPTLMLPAIQVSMRGSNLPSMRGNEAHYLKISLDLF